MWPREAMARSGDIVRSLIAKGTAKVFWVLQRSRAKRAGAKNQKVFGDPQG
jgi:hypothetical protein